jgi:G:T-mismatch repair DNA endonuclease (very short patch repair protein)
MNIELEKKIISEYKKGKSSLDIVKLINLPKKTVLKILNKHNLIRKRDRCNSVEINKIDDYYVITRVCPKCNEQIETKSKDRSIACRNHYNKIKNNTMCKPCSLKLQIGEGNPFYGKTHKKETKIKISKSREGKYKGSENHMKQEKYRKMSKDIMTLNWSNNILDRQVMSELLKQTRKSGKIKSVITSKKEKEIINELNEIGYTTIGSYRIDSKICDIFIPSLNLIIEYFGDYWHCNPNIYNNDYFNKKKNMFAWQIWEYDRSKLDLIKDNGYNLEVIWEGDLKNNNKIIKHIIKKYVTNTNFRTTPERS